MDGKTWAIAGLVVTALVLGTAVVGGLTDQAAYAQGGVYATYQGVTCEVQSDYVSFVLLDTASRRMVFYEYSVASKQLNPVTGRDLARDFQRKP